MLESACSVVRVSICYHDDKAPVIEWLLVAVSEVPETDGWWLFQIVTGFAELCEYFENCANIGRSIQRPQPNIATA